MIMINENFVDSFHSSQTAISTTALDPPMKELIFDTVINDNSQSGNHFHVADITYS
jgi:hypothetical protein